MTVSIVVTCRVASCSRRRAVVPFLLVHCDTNVFLGYTGLRKGSKKRIISKKDPRTGDLSN